MSKREEGKRAVEDMLRYGMPAVVINRILGNLPASNFTNGAYEQLIDAQAEKRSSDNGQS